MKLFKYVLLILLGVLVMAGKAKAQSAVYVTLETNLGNIKLELYPDKAPVTVKNFVQYVEEGFYDGVIFHRVIPGFMIQGGGFAEKLTEEYAEKTTREPIKNEAGNGLKNARGTIAMARTSVVNSATAQFFINVADNTFLNHVSDNPSEYGYAVFGKVIDGMDTADKIVRVKTRIYRGMRDWPVEPVIITKAYLDKETEKSVKKTGKKAK